MFKFLLKCILCVLPMATLIFGAGIFICALADTLILLFSNVENAIITESHITISVGRTMFFVLNAIIASILSVKEIKRLNEERKNRKNT